MSARALTWCWEQSPRTATQKLVLAALADRADDDGDCWPSTEWVARKCAPVSRQAVRRALDELEDQRLVEKTDRRRRGDGTLGTWTYHLPLDGVLQEPLPIERLAAGAASTSHHQRRLAQSSPAIEPVITGDDAEPSIEPSIVSTDVETPAPARPRDEVWDALVEFSGHEPSTKSYKAGWGKVVKELKEAGATGESVKQAAAAYVKTWPQMERNPFALLKWYDRFLTEGDGRNLRGAALAWARRIGVELHGATLEEELARWAQKGVDETTVAMMRATVVEHRVAA